MPVTALAHFAQDISRARALVYHADPLPQASPEERLLRSDQLRCGWMFAVGALDAYFCDAYTDVIAATIISKSRQPSMTLPPFFSDIRFPVSAILEPYERENWRWRMAARKLMERENVLSLAAIQTLFNKFFPSGQRFFADLLDAWMGHTDADKRLFGVSNEKYQTLTDPQKQDARARAMETLQLRWRAIFQRRHDCIHNCDRPRIAPQELKLARTVLAVTDDIEFLVRRCDEHITTGFHDFLVRMGCTPATLKLAGY